MWRQFARQCRKLIVCYPAEELYRPKGVVAQSPSTTSVRVTWKWKKAATQSNVSSCVLETCVQYWSSARHVREVCTREAVTERVIEGLACGNAYYFRVVAKVAAGDEVSRSYAIVPGGE